MDSKTITVEVKCRWCGKLHYIKIYESDLEKLYSGDLRPSKLYYLTPAERELLISQTCNDCWNRMFPEDCEY